MFIQRLIIQNFRNLQHVELETLPNFNLICGPNGAGKTSVLEAIYYLALARSFRNAGNQYLVQQGQSTFSLFAQIHEQVNELAMHTTIGMSRTRGEELQIKVNADPLLRRIDLVDHICVQVIHPQGIELITKEAEGRRSFVDWGVYYSDPSFKQLWLEYRKALKQRNALLVQNSTRYRTRQRRLWDCLPESADSRYSASEGGTLRNGTEGAALRNGSYQNPSVNSALQHAMQDSLEQNSDALTLKQGQVHNQVDLGQAQVSFAQPYNQSNHMAMTANTQAWPNESFSTNADSVLSVSQSQESLSQIGDLSATNAISPTIADSAYALPNIQGGYGAVVNQQSQANGIYYPHQAGFALELHKLSPVLQAHLQVQETNKAQAYATSNSPQTSESSAYLNLQGQNLLSSEQFSNMMGSSNSDQVVVAAQQALSYSEQSSDSLHNGSLQLESMPSQLELSAVQSTNLSASCHVDRQSQDSEVQKAIAEQTTYDTTQNVIKESEGALATKSAVGLKSLWSSPISEFSIWNEQIADLSEQINQKRLNYLGELQIVLQEIVTQFLPDFKLKFELYSGWEKGSDLRAQLAGNLEKERGLGYTLYGCHRADLKIKNHNLAAGATLSRGQLKMLVYAMRLAQGMLLKLQNHRSCIYLIDDLNSELDENSQRRLLNTLLECQHQVFISNIQSDFRNILIPHGRSDIRVFSLEQGRLVGTMD